MTKEECINWFQDERQTGKAKAGDKRKWQHTNWAFVLEQTNIFNVFVVICYVSRAITALLLFPSTLHFFVFSRKSRKWHCVNAGFVVLFFHLVTQYFILFSRCGFLSTIAQTFFSVGRWVFRNVVCRYFVRVLLSFRMQCIFACLSIYNYGHFWSRMGRSCDPRYTKMHNSQRNDCNFFCFFVVVFTLAARFGFFSFF